MSVANPARRVGPFLAWLVVVALAFSRQIASLLVDHNRFYFHWRYVDAWTVISAILLLAGIPAGLHWLARRRSETAGRWLDHALALALGWALLSAQPWLAPGSTAVDLILLALVAGVAFSLGGGAGHWLVGVERAAIVLSPFVGIFFFQLLVAGSWGSPSEPRPANGPALDREVAAPVYFFVFDGWSYPQSVNAGRVRRGLKNLRRLAERSTFFRRASSPGGTTRTSLPGILYQEELVPAPGGTWVPGVELKPPEGARTLFERARAAGRPSAVIGFYFPYRRMLAQPPDYVFSRSYVARGRWFGGRLGLLLARNLHYQADPLSQLLATPLEGRRTTRYWYRLNHEYREEASWWLEHGSADGLTFFHWPLPHGPFVFDSDGSFFPAEGGQAEGHSNLGGYRRQLRYFDHVVGEVVASIERGGRFDEALIVMTSDHGAFQQDMQHVPLIVKLPGQREGRVVDTPVGIDRLGPLIDAMLAGEPPREGWIEAASTEEAP